MKSKILYLGDLHIGARGGSEYMRDFIFDYLINHVIKAAKNNGVTDIIQTGDLMDVRKSIYARDMDAIRNKLIPALKEAGITMHVIPGNHDIALSDSVSLSWTSVLEQMSGGVIKNYSLAGDYEIGGLLVCMVPWVCKENLEEIQCAIELSQADVCVGHFEIAGFDMYTGSTCEHGSITPEELKNFKMVKSGHFHCRSKQGVIEYVGTPYHLTWQDYPDGTDRGYGILEVEEGKVVGDNFFNNQEYQSVFRVFKYDQAEDPNFKKYVTPEYLNEELGFEGQIVRIQVTNREASKNTFKKFVDAMKRCKAIDYMIVDNTEIIATSEIVVDEAILQMDVLQILNEKVEKSAGIDVSSVKMKLSEIVAEAQTRELV